MARNAFRIGDDKSSLSWNVNNEKQLSIRNATFEIKDNDNEVVAKIDGESGAAMFGKGAHKFNADGSLDFANGNFLYDIINGLAITGKIRSNSNGIKIVIDPTDRSLVLTDAKDEEIARLSIETSTEFGSRSRLYLKNTNAGLENSTTVHPEGIGSFDFNALKQIGMYLSSGLWQEPHFVMGYDGDGSPTQDISRPRLAAYMSINTLMLFANNLPTTSTGLKKGQIWNDNGTLRIVQ